jgi:hypothetical protein
MLQLTGNGPAIWGGSRYAGQVVLPDAASGQGTGTLAKKLSQWARRVWRAFCRPGTIFIACRRGRGTSLIDGRDIVPIDKAHKRH